MIEQVIAVSFSEYRPSPEVYTIRADTGRDLVLLVTDYPIMKEGASFVMLRFPTSSDAVASDNGTAFVASARLQNGTEALVTRAAGEDRNTTTAAFVAFRLPDGTEGVLPGTIDMDRNTVTAELDDAIVDAGDVPCQLRIVEDGKSISSFNFTVRVLGGVNA